jgi:putative hydrolase of HD superfamily
MVQKSPWVYNQKMKKKNAVAKKGPDQRKIVNFLYEVGQMRKINRMHRQALLTDDMSDNIASHSYRVTIISWFLAKSENADPYKTVMMSLFHDVAEVRSNDHNWIHKKYIKVFEDEINKDQVGELPFPDLMNFVGEYDKRESKEAILAKDADLLDQILLLREYAWAGNKEAHIWLYGSGKAKKNYSANLKSETGKRLAELMYDISPSDWWRNVSTNQNRKS